MVPGIGPPLNLKVGEQGDVGTADRLQRVVQEAHDQLGHVLRLEAGAEVGIRLPQHVGVHCSWAEAERRDAVRAAFDRQSLSGGEDLHLMGPAGEPRCQVGYQGLGATELRFPRGPDGG